MAVGFLGALASWAKTTGWTRLQPPEAIPRLPNELVRDCVASCLDLPTLVVMSRLNRANRTATVKAFVVLRKARFMAPYIAAGWPREFIAAIVERFPPTIEKLDQPFRGYNSWSRFRNLPGPQLLALRDKGAVVLVDSIYPHQRIHDGLSQRGILVFINNRVAALHEDPRACMRYKDPTPLPQKREDATHINAIGFYLDATHCAPIIRDGDPQALANDYEGSPMSGSAQFDPRDTGPDSCMDFIKRLFENNASAPCGMRTTYPHPGGETQTTIFGRPVVSLYLPHATPLVLPAFPPPPLPLAAPAATTLERAPPPAAAAAAAPGVLGLDGED